jgi:hypothetical protein
MKMQQVSDNCFAVLNEKNRICDANSGLINWGGGVVMQNPALQGRKIIHSNQPPRIGAHPGT